MVLYHAISSYQLLCAMVHKILKNPGEKSVLLLPDFIVKKYPQYTEVVKLGIFDEVYLFPYLKIDHCEETIKQKTAYYYELTVPYKIDMFREINILGGHFYFSTYLIQKKIEFNFFEDAPGMLKKSEQLFYDLYKKYPVHAQVAQDNGLFSGENEYIKTVYCLEGGDDNKFVKFDIHLWLKELKKKDINKIIKFFRVDKIKIKKKTVVFFTQQFASLGIMSQIQQRNLISWLVNRIEQEVDVVVKTHPDDNEKYDFSERVEEIRIPFPAELLPFIVSKRAMAAVTISSTSVIGAQYFCKYTFSFAEVFKDMYSHRDEYVSMINIMKYIEEEGKSYVQFFKKKESRKESRKGSSTQRHLRI